MNLNVVSNVPTTSMNIQVSAQDFNQSRIHYTGNVQVQNSNLKHYDALNVCKVLQLTQLEQQTLTATQERKRMHNQPTHLRLQSRKSCLQQLPLLTDVSVL